jgi:hypothetical protein
VRYPETPNSYTKVEFLTALAVIDFLYHLDRFDHSRDSLRSVLEAGESDWRAEEA